MNSFQLLFISEKERKKIISFHLNGEEITDKRFIMSSVFYYEFGVLHTKSHLFSNYITEYVVDNSITVLEPSTITSYALHHGLLYSQMSVLAKQRGLFYKIIGHMYISNVDIDSLLCEAKNFDILKGHNDCNRENPSEFIRYLRLAHDIMENAIDNHNLPKILLEPLFNHIIVHAIDHLNMWRFSKDLYFGHFLQRKYSPYDAFCNLFSRSIFAKPVSNPLFNNKIKTLTNNAFYAELYMELKILDKKFGVDYAEWVTASIMY